MTGFCNAIALNFNTNMDIELIDLFSDQLNNNTCSYECHSDYSDKDDALCLYRLG